MKRTATIAGLGLLLVGSTLSANAVTFITDPSWTITTDTAGSFVGSVTALSGALGDYFPTSFGDLPASTGAPGLPLLTPTGVSYALALVPVTNPGLHMSFDGQTYSFGSINPGIPANPFLDAPGTLSGEYFNTFSGNHVYFTITTFLLQNGAGSSWNADFAFNVEPVPEPGETALCGLLGLGTFVVWRRWKRRAG